jgi:hypothetical protein
MNKGKTVGDWGRGFYVRQYSSNNSGGSEGKNHLEDPSVDGDNIKMDLQEVGCGDIEWIELAQYRDRWRALVNEVMNLCVP